MTHNYDTILFSVACGGGRLVECGQPPHYARGYCDLVISYPKSGGVVHASQSLTLDQFRALRDAFDTVLAAATSQAPSDGTTIKSESVSRPEGRTGWTSSNARPALSRAPAVASVRELAAHERHHGAVDGHHPGQPRGKVSP